MEVKQMKDMFRLKQAGLCPFCGEKPDVNDFTDELSLKEHYISGLCKDCMDGFFTE